MPYYCPACYDELSDEEYKESEGFCWCEFVVYDSDGEPIYNRIMHPYIHREENEFITNILLKTKKFSVFHQFMPGSNEHYIEICNGKTHGRYCAEDEVFVIEKCVDYKPKTDKHIKTRSGKNMVKYVRVRKIEKL